MDTLKELKEIYVKLAGVIGDIQEPPPDPLAEWRALEPGRKVFYPREQQVYTFMGIDDEQMIFENDEGEWDVDITEKELSKWQIIPLGPFDGRKLRVGDWVWVEGQTSPEYTGWAKIADATSSELHLDIEGHEIKTGYNINGTRFQVFGNGRLHYYPPSLDQGETEEQRKERVCLELSKDKRFVEFALKVVSGELDGNATCPINAGVCSLSDCQPSIGCINKATPCYALYGDIYGCPCKSHRVGLSVVKADLLHIIKLAAGV